jgi:hypothetical protein
MNEMTILMVCYGFYILIDISVPYEGKSFVGRSVILFISGNIVFNIVRTALITGLQLYLSAKVAYKSRKQSSKE